MISLNNFDANVDCTDNKGYFERGLRVDNFFSFLGDSA